MRRAWLVLTFGVSLGCGHTHAATDAPPPSAEVARPARRHAAAATGAPLVVASPEAALAPDGLEKIQARLVATGHLDASEASGHLDDATKRALIELQRKRNLPATGIPDDTTVRALGLEPDAIFRKAPP